MNKEKKVHPYACEEKKIVPRFIKCFKEGWISYLSRRYEPASLCFLWQFEPYLGL